MSFLTSSRESDLFSDPSSNEQWWLGPSQPPISASSSTVPGPDAELHAILSTDQVPKPLSLESSESLTRDQDDNRVALDPLYAQTQTTPRRWMSDASWDTVRKRRTEHQHTSPSSSNVHAGTSSGPWRPWDDHPAIQSASSNSGPSGSNKNTETPSFYIPPDHKILPSHSPDLPSQSRILELLDSMNHPSSASPSKGNDDGVAQEEEEDPTSLSTFTCSICFSPPENATLTPCGHVMCGKCLFSAVRAARQRHAALYGREGLAPDGTRNEAVCPVCRASIPGWDGRGGGVIGLSIMVEEG